MPVPADHDPKSMDPPSENMKAADFAPGQKWTLKVRDVVLVNLDARPGEQAQQKYALYFEGKKLRYVTNATARKSPSEAGGSSLAAAAVEISNSVSSGESTTFRTELRPTRVS